MISVLLYIREFYSKLALEGTSTNTDVLEAVRTDASFSTTLSNPGKLPGRRGLQRKPLLSEYMPIEGVSNRTNFLLISQAHQEFI